jgi:putative hydrolase of the HAD superfamily
MVPAMLRAMGVADLFELVVLSVDHGFRKPHPSIYEEALRRLDCPAHEVAFIGDSYDADYIGPRQAGMTAFLIDPRGDHAIPREAQLPSLLDIEARLAQPAGVG